MYQPLFAVRAEILLTDADTLQEWRVVMNGAVRGGLTVAHGYLPTSGPLLAEAVEDILATCRAALETYAVGMSPLEAKLEAP